MYLILLLCINNTLSTKLLPCYFCTGRALFRTCKTSSCSGFTKNLNCFYYPFILHKDCWSTLNPLPRVCVSLLCTDEVVIFKGVAAASKGYFCYFSISSSSTLPPVSFPFILRSSWAISITSSAEEGDYSPSLVLCVSVLRNPIRPRMWRRHEPRS